MRPLTAAALFSVSSLLVFGMSIFVRVVVYLGGRYDRKRFSDRIIDLIMVRARDTLATALFGAVFVCIFNSRTRNQQANPPGYAQGFAVRC